MIIEPGRDLHNKVQLFKKWSKRTHPDITEDNDNGEWCFCKEFDDMFSSVMELIQKAPASSADDQMIHDLLYAIADPCPRDGKIQRLVFIVMQKIPAITVYKRQMAICKRIEKS